MASFKKACEVLRLQKIFSILETFAVCDDTKKFCKNINPSSKFEVVKKLCCETDEAVVVCIRFKSPDFFNLKTPEQILKKASYGIFIDSSNLLNIAKILKQSRYLVSFYKKNNEYFKYLKEYFDEIFYNTDLENLIFKCIISQEEISDQASEDLRNIRQKIKKQNIKIKNILEKYTKGDTKKYLQDKIITVRDGRHVIAVKGEFSKYVPGIVQDVSSSGATLFVEPSLVVEADNELKILQKEEYNEIIKILKKLTEKCLVFSKEITKSYKNILKLDLIFAKAKFAISINAIKPEIVNSGEIVLKKAKHPLINKDVVVPIDIEFGGSIKNLVITGPNTGGKTVCLKTVGLFCLMIMCGLLIPVEANSKISVFEKVLVAIGDEQSIENSLSTFSAHIKNIVYILKVVNKNSLVLIDELASGTDPEQGAALAVSIVEKICSKKASLAATTHYTALKTFAFKNDLIRNACFEFNIKTFEPTYKLLIGVAGQSYAFFIAKKLGINNYLINRAKTFMSKKAKYFEEVLEELEKSRIEYKKKFLNLEQTSLKLKELEKNLEEKQKELDISNKNIIDKTKQEATNLIDEVRANASEILSELKDIKNKKNINNINELTSRTKSIVKNSIYGLYDKVESRYKNQTVKVEYNEKFEIGDRVLVTKLNQKGIVMEISANSDKILVDIGNIKTRVSSKNLTLISKKQKQSKKINFKKTLSSKKDRKIKTEIDLRGHTVEEALLDLDMFIDSCVLNNFGIATIIHGKGTGALRSAIAKHLKTHPNVLNSRLGVFGEGEDGVTIIELK